MWATTTKMAHVQHLVAVVLLVVSSFILNSTTYVHGDDCLPRLPDPAITVFDSDIDWRKSEFFVNDQVRTTTCTCALPVFLEIDTDGDTVWDISEDCPGLRLHTPPGSSVGFLRGTVRPYDLRRERERRIRGRRRYLMKASEAGGNGDVILLDPSDGGGGGDIIIVGSAPGAAGGGTGDIIIVGSSSIRVSTRPSHGGSGGGGRVAIDYSSLRDRSLRSTNMYGMHYFTEQEFEWAVEASPRDTASCQPTGKRRHKALLPTSHAVCNCSFVGVHDAGQPMHRVSFEMDTEFSLYIQNSVLSSTSSVSGVQYVEEVHRVSTEILSMDLSDPGPFTEGSPGGSLSYVGPCDADVRCTTVHLRTCCSNASMWTPTMGAQSETFTDDERNEIQALTFKPARLTPYPSLVHLDIDMATFPTSPPTPPGASGASSVCITADLFVDKSTPLLMQILSARRLKSANFHTFSGMRTEYSCPKISTTVFNPSDPSTSTVCLRVRERPLLQHPTFLQDPQLDQEEAARSEGELIRLVWPQDQDLTSFRVREVVVGNRSDSAVEVGPPEGLFDFRQDSRPLCIHVPGPLDPETGLHTPGVLRCTQYYWIDDARFADASTTIVARVHQGCDNVPPAARDVTDPSALVSTEPERCEDGVCRCPFCQCDCRARTGNDLFGDQDTDGELCSDDGLDDDCDGVCAVDNDCDGQDFRCTQFEGTTCCTSCLDKSDGCFLVHCCPSCRHGENYEVSVDLDLDDVRTDSDKFEFCLTLTTLRGSTEVTSKSKHLRVVTSPTLSLSVDVSDSGDLSQQTSLDLPVTFCVCLPDATGLHVCDSSPPVCHPGELLELCLSGPEGWPLRLSSLSLLSFNGAVRTAVRGGLTVDGLTRITPGDSLNDVRVSLFIDEALVRGRGTVERKTLSVSATLDFDPDDDNDGDNDGVGGRRSLGGMFEREDDRPNLTTVTMSGTLGDGIVRRSLEPEPEETTDIVQTVVELELEIVELDDSVNIGTGGSVGNDGGVGNAGSPSLASSEDIISSNSKSSDSNQKDAVVEALIICASLFALGVVLLVCHHHSRSSHHGTSAPPPSPIVTHSSTTKAKSIDDVFHDEEDQSSTSFTIDDENI